MQASVCGKRDREKGEERKQPRPWIQLERSGLRPSLGTTRTLGKFWDLGLGPKLSTRGGIYEEAKASVATLPRLKGLKDQLNHNPTGCVQRWSDTWLEQFSSLWLH